jgi:hypothetical protein
MAEQYRTLARECYELAQKTQNDVRRRELILLTAKRTELAEFNENPVKALLCRSGGPALPLFATRLGGLGLLGWRRKRKASGSVNC